MREGARHLLVGVISILAVAGFVFLLFSFGEIKALRAETYDITILTDHAAGIRPGASVQLNGVPIGVVATVTVTGSVAEPVRIICAVEQHVVVPEGVVPAAQESLLGGSATLEFDSRGINSARPLPVDGTAVVRETIRSVLFERVMKEIDRRTGPITDAMQRFAELSATYESLGSNLNAMLERQTPEMIADGIEPNIRTAVRRLNDTLTSMDAALELTRQWLDDEEMRENLRAAARRASEVLDEASTTMESLRSAATTIESDTDLLTARLGHAADELALTLEEVRLTNSLVREGEGTLGLLLRDPTLYYSLDDAARRFDMALRDLMLLIDKVRAEGMQIGF